MLLESDSTKNSQKKQKSIPVIIYMWLNIKITVGEYSH